MPRGPKAQHQQDGEETDHGAVVGRQERVARVPPPRRSTSAPSTAPGMLPRPPSTAAANIARIARKPVSGSIEVSRPSSMPPRPGHAHRGEIDQMADPLRIDSPERGQHRVVRHRAHRLAQTGERQEAEQRQHRGGGDRQILQLLRPDAQAGEPPVALDRQVVVAQSCCRTPRRTRFSSAMRQRDRGDGGGDQPGGPQRPQRHRIGHHAGHAGRQERHQRRRQQRPMQIDVGDVAGERTDRHVRCHREIRKPQHGVDRGEADRRRAGWRPP